MKSALGMMTDPKNKAMMDIMAQQNPAMKSIITIMGCLGKIYAFYEKVRAALANKFIKLFIFGLFVLLIAYYFT